MNMIAGLETTKSCEVCLMRATVAAEKHCAARGITTRFVHSGFSPLPCFAGSVIYLEHFTTAQLLYDLSARDPGKFKIDLIRATRNMNKNFAASWRGGALTTGLDWKPAIPKCPRLLSIGLQ